MAVLFQGLLIWLFCSGALAAKLAALRLQCCERIPCLTVPTSEQGKTTDTCQISVAVSSYIDRWILWLSAGILESDLGSTNGSGIPGYLAKHIFAGSGLWTGLSLSLMPLGKSEPPQDVAPLDPDT